jgi:hypothetical protein
MKPDITKKVVEDIHKGLTGTGYVLSDLKINNIKVELQ